MGAGCWNAACFGMTRLDRPVRHGRGGPGAGRLQMSRGGQQWRAGVMAGFSATAGLPATAAPDVMTALGAALAPFGATSDSHWDRGYFWDSWRIAGGADGHGFWIAPGRQADSWLIHDSPDYRGRVDLSLPGHCAGGPENFSAA